MTELDYQVSLFLGPVLGFVCGWLWNSVREYFNQEQSHD